MIDACDPAGQPSKASMKTLLRKTKGALAATPLIALIALASPHVLAAPAITAADISDNALLQTLPGFTGAHAVVNGIALHYVIGGP